MPKFNLAPLFVYSVFSIWVCFIAKYFSMFFSFINSVSCTGDCAPFRTELVMPFKFQIKFLNLIWGGKQGAELQFEFKEAEFQLVATF